MTTTMSESFDAQMSDAGDLDISMYPTMSTTDSWLSVEASMGDDTFGTGSTTFEYVQDGNEVEMGDDDEVITEYEMADGDGYDGHEELQDIEVYDMSQAASPLMLEDRDATVNLQHEDTEPMHIPSDDLIPVADPPPPVESAVQPSDAYSAGELTQPASSPIDPVVVVYDLDVAQQQNDRAMPATATISEGYVVDDPSAPLGDDPDVARPFETNLEVLGVARALSSSEVPEHTSAESTAQSHHDPASPLQDYEADRAEDPADAAEQRVYDSEVNHAAATNESGDPHEISEGVYIDPPPPVLLSLPPAVEFGECSLFNLPTSSVPQSPSSSSKPASDEGLHLLLHDRPTLYYEPLSAVFTALRQEQYIHDMPGFSEAELVLDAFDLQLCISEDNVYTHEVTLHELNVIHDGSDLHGPLRLRLKVITPRFVTRYTTLREQIARLNLTDGDDTHVVTIAVQPPSHDEDAASNSDQQPEEAEYTAQGHDQPDASRETAEAHNDPTVVDDLSPGDSVALPSFSESVVQEQAEAEVAAQVTAELGGGEAEAGGEIGNLSEVVQDGEAVRKLESALHPTVEVVAEDLNDDDEYEESEETLDADEVHEPFPDEGGDYVEHSAFPDDEDEFDEDFPEKTDGEAADGAYPHIGAIDDTTQYAEDVEETRELFDDVYDASVDPAHNEDSGLTEEASTDDGAHFNSLEAPGGAEDEQSSSSEVHPHDTNARNLDTGAAPRHDSTTVTDDDELDDNWDDPELSPVKPTSIDQSDTLSRKSSTTTLASRNSKRAYGEVELDELEDDDIAPESPDVKRARVE